MIVSILFVTAISKKEEEEGAEEEEGEEDDEEERRRRRRRLIFKCVVFLCDYCSIIISKQIDTELISEIIHVANRIRFCINSCSDSEYFVFWQLLSNVEMNCACQNTPIGIVNLLNNCLILVL